MMDWMNDTFKTILDDISSGIFVCGADMKIKYINKFYAHLLRTSPDEAVGKDIRDFFPDSRVPHVLESGQPELRQHCLHKKEITGTDTDITLLVNRLPVKNHEQTEAVVVEIIFKDSLQVKDFVHKNNLLKKKVRRYQKCLDTALSPTYSLESIIGTSVAIEQTKKQLKRFALSSDSLLILGPTGSGKELFAHAAHVESNQSSGPFVCVNCAAIPKELLEAELFGYEKGAFTGASDNGRAGKIELANGGSLFLDEIGDLSLESQAKLLRVLETKTIERLGSSTSKDVNFRLICATNADLESMIQHRQFREDLYYRINTMTLNIPSLLERREDIMPLAHYFVHSNNNQYMEITKRSKDLLISYDWPGNIRELKNCMVRAHFMSENGKIEPKHLPTKIRQAGYIRFFNNQMNNNSFHKKIAEFEKFLLAEMLEKTQNNKKETAKKLGISRSTLYDKCKMYGLLDNTAIMN
jgi:transcriptional regulator with PAS, ATPase and Fis domain